MDGILLVDKPRAFTSHDVVDIIRRRFGFKKVGHAGTLDPIATGLLVILIGSYTKRSSEFLNHDKEYEATMTLGATSDTQDAWGKITPCVSKGINAADVEGVFKKFSGPMEQDVPAFSAKKINGKKSYELARKGIEVKLQPQKIVIHSMNVTRIDLPRVSFSVRCSKGTYVRQICSDIESALGCGAYMSELRRTSSGSFRIEDAVGVDKLKEMAGTDLEKYLKL
jgi:tRNA pseudouridine55 synthase